MIRVVIRAVNFNDQNVSSIGTLKVDNIFADLLAELHANISAIHYKPSGAKQLQMLCHTVALNETFHV